MNVIRPSIAFLGMLLTIQSVRGFGEDTNIQKITIPLSPKATTNQDFRKARREWGQRTMVKPFRESLKGHPSDEFAMPFVEQAMVDWADFNNNIDYDAVIALGRRALDAGCDDPLVLYLWAYLKARQSGYTPGPVSENIGKAMKQLAGSRYLKGVCLQAALSYRAACSSNHQSPKEAEELILEWSRQALLDGSYTREQEPLFVATVVIQSSAIVKLLQPVVNSSSMEEWAKKTILGFREVDAAWEERGDGFANTVTEKGWEGFKLHLGKAREALNEAWKLRPDQPYAAAKMITVIMGGGGNEDDTLKKWFDRAVSAQLDNGIAYDCMRNALSPRWGGSNDELLAFGRACLATKRFDTNIPSHYLECLRDIIKNGPDTDPIRFYRRPDIARDIASFEAKLNDPTRLAEKPIISENLAMLGWLSGNYEMASHALKEIKGPWHSFNLTPLAAYGINVQILRSDVEIGALGASGDFIKADNYYSAGRTGEAEELYRAVAAKCADAKHLPFRLANRLAAIQLEKQLESGEWIPLKPDLDSWRIKSGDWSITDDGALMSRGNDGEAMILAPGYLGKDFEVRGEFQITTPANSGCNFAVILGWRAAAPKDWIACLTLKDQSTHSFTFISEEYSNRRHENFKNTKIEAKNQFLVQAWQGKIAYYFNRKPIRTDFPAKYGEWRDEMIGFGGPLLNRETITTIRNLEVRKLKSAPLAPPSEEAPKP